MMSLVTPMAAANSSYKKKIEKRDGEVEKREEKGREEVDGS
jgi:hypothetical protein